MIPKRARLLLAVLASQLVWSQTPATSSPPALYFLNALSGDGLIFDSPATLYRFKPGSQLQAVAQLAAGGISDSVDFAFVDYDRRVVVVATPKTTPRSVSFLSMDVPTQIARIPLGTGSQYDRFSALSACLMETAPGQLAIAQMLARTLVEPTESSPIPVMEREILATPLTAASEAQRLPNGDATYCRSSGYFGTVWDHAPRLSLDVKPNARLRINHDRSTKFDIGPVQPLPQTAKTTSFGNFEVRNDSALVFTSEEERTFNPSGLGTSVHHVYSTKLRIWNSLKVPGSDTSVRAFGGWLAFVVRERQAWAIPGKSGVSAFDSSRQRFSPGTAGQSLNRLPNHPEASMATVLGESEYWLPGTLLCYEVETGKLYHLDTGQGDSEILLIDGSDVYYRVNTSLYKGSVGARTISPGERLADDPVIGNAHWAFLSSR